MGRERRKLKKKYENCQEIRECASFDWFIQPGLKKWHRTFGVAVC
jgi:hypothetical protein